MEVRSALPATHALSCDHTPAEAIELPSRESGTLSPIASSSLGWSQEVSGTGCWCDGHPNLPITSHSPVPLYSEPLRNPRATSDLPGSSTSPRGLTLNQLPWPFCQAVPVQATFPAFRAYSSLCSCRGAGPPPTHTLHSTNPAACSQQQVSKCPRVKINK